MDTPSSILRRRSQVFVEIPPSPFHSSRSSMGSRSQQEATPLKTVAMNVDSLSTPSNPLKRRSPDAPQGMSRVNVDTQQSKPKKLKTEKASKQGTTANVVAQSDKVSGEGGDASIDVYRCHQCARKFEKSGLAMCTFKRSVGKRCVLKYCKACMRNRYKEDIAMIKGQSGEGSSPLESEHVEDEGYLYKCPRCREICNCRTCRKNKGLPAARNMNQKTIKQAEADNTRDAIPNNKASGSMDPGPDSTQKNNGAKVKSLALAKLYALKPHVLVPPSPYRINASKQKQPLQKRRVRKPKSAPPSKPMPRPVWTIVPFTLTFDDAVKRMNIREFLLRFAHLTEVARCHLEELEELATADPYVETVSNDDDMESDGPRLVGWISGNALKAILIGLLTLLLKDAGEGEDVSTLSTAIQQIRGSGINLDKMWSALDSLRNQDSLAIPDVLPPPAGASRSHGTRNSRDTVATRTVVSTAQVVRVIAALVEMALQTKAVRDDFERGVIQEKDIARAMRELAASENARWKDVKATGVSSKANKGEKAKQEEPSAETPKDAGTTGDKAEKKAAKSAHDAAVATFDYAREVAASECIARFGPLGRDTEGRIYYALTPGVIEREAAVELLEGGTGVVKFRRRRTVVEEGERKRLKHWSWFVAVWGRKPEGAEVAKMGEDEDTDENTDEDREQWWGFWEPKQIASLGEWLAMSHEIDLDAKRVSKNTDDNTALDVNNSGLGKWGEDKKSRGRPSNASSAGNTSRSFASLNATDSEESDHDGSASDSDEDVQMRLNDRREPVPTKQDLRALAKGLKDYADLLEWRIKRSTLNTKEDRRASLHKEDGVDKNIPKVPEIPPARFYGK